MYRTSTKYSIILQHTLIAGLIALISIAWSGRALAVGMGAAKVESFIGEPLEVLIPINNLDRNENISVELDQNTVSLLDESPLIVELQETGDQLFAIVRSDFAVNEPYLSFSLSLRGDSSRSTKQFTVLLDLRSDQTVADKKSASERTIVGSSVTSSSAGAAGRTGKSVAKLSNGKPRSVNSGKRNRNVGSGKKVVASGETLWGIARQASKGTNVSINQMMVAIYQNNTSAFAKGSIDLLMAGSTIDIPDFAEATQMSNDHAVERIRDLSGQKSTAASLADSSTIENDEIENTESEVSNSSSDVAPTLAVDSEVDELFSAEDLEQQLSEDVDDATVSGGEQFKLTSIAETSEGSSIGLQTTTDPQAQEMIDSLAETVGNLTQDIIEKEKQVQYLEDRIKALESFQAQERVQDSGISASIAGTGPDSEKNYLWWLLPFGVLALLALFFRDWIVARFQSKPEIGDIMTEHQPTQIDRTAASNTESEAQRDYSVLTSRRAKPSPSEESNNEDTPDVAFIEIETKEADEESNFNEQNRMSDESVETIFAEQDSEVEDDLESDQPLEFTLGEDLDADGEYDLSELIEQEGQSVLSEHLDKLHEERNFDAALSLLTSERGNGLSEGQYYFERLRLFKATDDIEGFINQYDEIKQSLDSFEIDVVADIEKLVKSNLS